MSKKLLALYDADLDYINRFLRYVKKKNNLPFKTAGFTSYSALKDFLERNNVDILLFSDNTETFRNGEVITDKRIGETILFGDTAGNRSGVGMIYKYQSAENIIHEIVSECKLEQSDDKTALIMADVNMIGIYSPGDQAVRQAFAVSCANAASNDRSVLYISLDRFSGFADEDLSGNRMSFSDLLYYFKTDQKKLRPVLSQIRQKTGGFDLITGPEDMGDMDLIEDELWPEFFLKLAESGSYDLIILDMSEAFRELENIFSVCRIIFVPVTQEYLAEEKLKQLKDRITETEGEKMLDKLEIVNISRDLFRSDDHDSGRDGFLKHCLSAEMMSLAEKSLYRKMDILNRY